MEAEDTVIKMKWMDKETQKDQDALLLKQAKISFDAGRKEVVEWLSGCMLREHRDFTKDEKVFCRDYRVYVGEWQAKLKEWNCGD